MKIYIKKEINIYGTTYYHIMRKRWFADELLAMALDQQRANELFEKCKIVKGKGRKFEVIRAEKIQ